MLNNSSMSSQLDVTLVDSKNPGLYACMKYLSEIETVRVIPSVIFS